MLSEAGGCKVDSWNMEGEGRGVQELVLLQTWGGSMNVSTAVEIP
jgi:hypothetical protein